MRSGSTWAKSLGFGSAMTSQEENDPEVENIERRSANKLFRKVRLKTFSSAEKQKSIGEG